MTDQEHADEINRAVYELNEAVYSAQDDGVGVEIHKIDRFSFDRGFFESVSAKITRRT
jgi:hypothetical protein